LFRMHPGWHTSCYVYNNCPFYLELLAMSDWCMYSKFQWGVKRLKKDEDVGSCVCLGYRWWQAKQEAESWCHQQTWMFGRWWKLFVELSSIFYRFCTYYSWPNSSSTEYFWHASRLWIVLHVADDIKAILCDLGIGWVFSKLACRAVAGPVQWNRLSRNWGTQQGLCGGKCNACIVAKLQSLNWKLEPHINLIKLFSVLFKI
jgi:hypothetical protein